MHAQIITHATCNYLIDAQISTSWIVSRYHLPLCCSQAKYITGRDRVPGQVNGKSENLNHALRNHIFKEYLMPNATSNVSSGSDEEHGISKGVSSDFSASFTSSSVPSVRVTLDEGLDWQLIPSRELIVVFDADMRAKPDFFLKTLEVMADESLQLVLTPQV